MMESGIDPNRPQSRGGNFDPSEGGGGFIAREDRDPEKEKEIMTIREQLEEHQRLLKESEVRDVSSVGCTVCSMVTHDGLLWLEIMARTAERNRRAGPKARRAAQKFRVGIKWIRPQSKVHGGT
jgi:hypothetical protein